MKYPTIVSVHSFKEFVDAGIKPHLSANHPWLYLLCISDNRYGFSLNKTTPTTWTEPCENGCKDGWHLSKCIQEYRKKISTN